MLLIVDTNILVGEVTRARGRRLLGRSELELLITERAWDEARHEIPKRYERMAQAGRLTLAEAQEAANAALLFLTPLVQPIGPVYPPPVENHTPTTAVFVADFIVEAQRRIPDPDDVQTGALALAAGAAIWSEDTDFRGCGIAVWTTERLIAYLESA